MAEYARTSRVRQTTDGRSTRAAVRPASSSGGEGSSPGPELQKMRGALNEAPRARGVMQLQRRLARSPRAAVVQRLPTARSVAAAMGSPKKGLQFGKGAGLEKLLPRLQSEQYRAVLSALDAFDAFVRGLVGGTRAQTLAQLKTLLDIYDNVITACSHYEGQDDHTKAEYFQNLKLQAQNEKGHAIAGMIGWAESVEQRADYEKTGRTIQNVIGGAMMLAGTTVMNEAHYHGDVGGGTNTLNVFRAGGQDYFFKPNQAQLDVFADAHDENRALEATQGAPAAAGAAFIAKQNRTNLSKDAGISVSDSRTAAREVASYRLDALLQGDLIARTQFALRRAPAGGPMRLGSVQEGARGHQAGAFDVQKPTRDAADKAAVGAGAYLSRDPNLARLLSRLHLLDTLALQLDRNLGNFYILLDAHGNVQDVTGIDLDVSFGTATTIERGRGAALYSLPGLSQFVDRDMAEKILALDVELIRLTFSDLLSHQEIAALLARLATLQGHLQRLKDANQLLSGAQWAAAVMHMTVTSETYQRILQQKAEQAPVDRKY